MAATALATNREALAVFDAEDVLQDAVDELQGAGFDCDDLYVLLPGDAVKKHPAQNTLTAANDPGVQIGVRSMGIFEGTLVTVPAYILATAAIANAAARGANLGATVVAAIIGCGIGGILGALLVAWLKRRGGWRIKNHVDHRSPLLWVIARDSKRERRASEILAHYPVRDDFSFS